MDRELIENCKRLDDAIRNDPDALGSFIPMTFCSTGSIAAVKPRSSTSRR